MSHHDFTVVDLDGRIRAVVEARGRSGTSATWAKGFRRNVLSHGGAPTDALFVVVTPDRLYAWEPGLPAEASPSTELELTSILGPYFARVGATPVSIEPTAFELLVSWWLHDLSRAVSPDMRERLEGSGVADALAGARVVHEAA